MTARLRILPISCREEGQPTHYLILDGTGAAREHVAEMAARLTPKVAAAGGVLLVTNEAVDLPEVDEDYADHALAEAAREAAYTEPDYGTQWERWQGMMAKWEAQTSENASDAGHNVEAYLPGETHDNAKARALAADLLALVGASPDLTTSVTVDAQGNVSVERIDNTRDRNVSSVDYPSDYGQETSSVEGQAPVNAEGPSEPDYGTQWERWLGMMERYEAQTTETSQAILDAYGPKAEPVCKASREVEASGWVICDGQGHGREHHSGRLTTGPSVGNRYAWPFGPADRARLLDAQELVFTVNVENVHPLDLGHRVLMELREYERVTARRA